MSALDLVVYLADKLEPARRYPGVAELRTLAWSHLGQAFLASTDWHIGYLRSRGLSPHPDTLAARESIERSLRT